MKIDKNFSVAWTLLGHRHYELEEYDQATSMLLSLPLNRWGLLLSFLDAYNRAAELNPYDFRTWFGLGKIQKQLGSMTIAIQNFKKCALSKQLLVRFEVGSEWTGL